MRWCRIVGFPLGVVAVLLVITSVASRANGLEVEREIKGPVSMEADSLVYDHVRGMISLSGEVRIKYDDSFLQADYVEYYTEAKDMLAEGNVILREGEDILRCDRLEFNMETKKGIVYNGHLFLKRKNFHITGSKAEKLGEVEYRVYDATLTSCDAKVPDWKFSAKRLDVTVEGYGTSRWAGFHVLDIPVVYFPWARFPVKIERQTGFLLPEFGSSSRWGPEILVPFYWAIAPNHDATFYVQRIGDSRGRGFKEGAEYRYALNKQTWGAVRGNYIWDEIEKDHRWSIFHDHVQTDPRGYYITSNINLVSDNEYVVDFDGDLEREDLIDSRSLNQLESTLAFGKNWDWGVVDTQFSYFRDLTVDSNERTMQRLPMVTFAVFQNQFMSTPFFYELDSQAVNFWREEGTRGERIDLHPRVSAIQKVRDVVRLEASAGFRETVYMTEDDPDDRIDHVTSRELYDLGAAAETTIARSYRLGGESGAALWHTIEPRLEYSYIPDVDQDDLPLYDDRDAIAPENAVTGSITSRVMGKGYDAEGRSTYREYLYLTLRQAYDFSWDFPNGERLSNLVGEMDFKPVQWLTGYMDAEYDVHGRAFPSYDTGVRVSDTRGDSVGIEYRYTKEYVEELNARARIRVIKPLDLWVAYRHNLQDDVRIETVYGLEYRSQCWGLRMWVEDINKSPDRLRDDEIKVTVLLTLSGIGVLQLM